ncbi:MAG: thiamine pyrophosphate-binding protein [Clostridiales bacterium]|jgi:acetolactate synthase-1/2/3 large subunit|nr:thiamine pyrophosphate-binding protein [Clostridiales bacterium]
MDVNQCIVKIIESLGVGHVFGGSGQVNASMLLALEKSESVKTVIVKNEQAASFMACGYAMFSHKLGVCFATGGPGAFNLFSGMAVAYSDSLPVLAITGYTSAALRGKGALNESTGLSRTPDSHGMFGATTKKSFIIEAPEQTCDIMEEAVNLAFDGRPGPVHIHIPKDITVAQVPEFRAVKLQVKPVAPDPAKVREAAAALSSGKKPALLIGYGAVRAGAGEALTRLIEKTGIPFMTTMDAKGYLPENHPLSLGVFGTSGDKSANAYFDGCDTVLAIGNSFAENATFAFNPALYDGKTLIHVNIDPHELGKVYAPQIGITGDGKLFAEALLPLTEERPFVPVARHKFADEAINHEGQRIHPAALVREISKNLPPKAVVLGDAGAHMLWLNCYLSLEQGQIYQNPGSFGPMASHVNASMGVACANPDRPVVCACGDGDYLMAGFELLTAVENNIPVVWVIFNNGEFNIIKKFLINMFGRHAYMRFKNPDYVKYAEACGAEGFRVTKTADFAGVFKKALAKRAPVLIDAVVEQDVYPPFAMSRV